MLNNMLSSYVRSRHILRSFKGLRSRLQLTCVHNMTLMSKLVKANHYEQRMVFDSLRRCQYSVLQSGSADDSKLDADEKGLNELNNSDDDSPSNEGKGETPDDGTTRRNKTYYRAKQLCGILRKKQENIYKEFTLKYKKHYYTFQDGTYYEFPNSKEIIIDADVILKSKNKIYKNLLINSRKYVKRDLVSDRGIEKTSIIVILGHFNHGKTTLLDALGSFTIVEKEVHGITQEIRTCYLPIAAGGKESSVTIIDTPGQDIFYRMRNYGVSVADMVLLVVSLEDGVCSQTEESIGAVEAIINNYKIDENNGNGLNSVKNIPVIVCMNKMDSKALGDDVEGRIKSLQEELMEYNILENAIFVPISAKIGTNLEILKEKILDIVFKQKELENLRYIEEDEWSELEEEEKINDALKGQKEKEEVIEVDLSDDFHSLRNNSSSAGVLLDIVKSRKLGTTLHVVIRRGEVQEGDFFAAGGWSGLVKRISHEDGDSTLTNRTFENGRTSVARCGWGVKLTVTLNKLCDEPNPLGGEILFFSSDGSRSYKKLLELNRKKNIVGNESESDHTIDVDPIRSEEFDGVNNEEMRDNEQEGGEDYKGVSKQRQKHFVTYSEEAEQLAIDCADALRMQSQIDLYAMTDQAADRRNIPKLWDTIKKRGNKKKHDYDPVKERERMKRLYRTTIYDENGERIVTDNDMNENDDYDKEMLERDYEENNHNDNNGDDDDGSGDGESDGEEEEETEAIKDRNKRIKEKNREEEELSMLKQQNKKLGRNVMIRTLSDVYLSTITDCLDFENDLVVGETDIYQKYNDKGKRQIAPPPSVPLSIVSSSIGEITAKDIMIASAANATIMTYLLPVNSDAQRLAQERGVRMVAFDKFEDVIKIVKEGLFQELLEMAKTNDKSPQKKKNKNK